MSEKKISIAVIKRLPRYYRYLNDLLKMEIKRISSKELSARMGITASQIRQDLNCFGGFGQQGYGYNVQSLYNEIKNILGINKCFNTIIVGAGNLGQALANYSNFEKRGYKLIGIFDKDKSIVGSSINNMVVKDYDEVEEFVKEFTVHIAMLSVPYEQTPIVAERLVELGIKGLWNFSPMDLKIKKDVVIENVHLSDSIMVLGYRLNEILKKEEENKE